MITIRRKLNARGIWTYQISPEGHGENLPQPRFLPLDEHCDAIKGAIGASFLLVDSTGDERKIPEEDWRGYFEAAAAREEARELEDFIADVPLLAGEQHRRRNGPIL